VRRFDSTIVRWWRSLIGSLFGTWKKWENPVEIAQNAIKHAKANGFNVVIVDGRSFGCRSRNDG
jgi:signal recognition particle GTPase